MLQIPDLSFSSLKYGSIETPLCMKAFLYKGGAQVKRRLVSSLITNGSLGQPIAERLPLLVAIHEVLSDKIAIGGSKHTLQGTLNKIKQFYVNAEKNDRNLTIENIKHEYLSWVDTLKEKQRLKLTTEKAVYEHAYKLATPIAEVIGISSRTLIRAAGLKKPSKAKSALGKKSEKQRLDKLFEFGHSLFDITTSLSVKAIRGPIPIRINFRGGAVFDDWCGLVPISQGADSGELSANFNSSINGKRHRRWQADSTNETRFPAINLRLTAELLIFISQTGMNLAQATNFRVSGFSFQSHLDGYQVRRVYKNRKKGEVEFEIYSEYRGVFESYLKWRSEIFPNDTSGLLFPFIAPAGKTIQTVTRFNRIKKIMKLIGIQYTGPRSMRSARVNWYVRRSNDPDMTAEQAQHSKQTLFRYYLKPHHQIVVSEITNFWRQSDPLITPPSPGACVKREPLPIPQLATSAPRPDCANPAGCLFCVHHRDIDSFDHVWSLVSYRHLKTIEQSLNRTSSAQESLDQDERVSPAELVIDRISTKLAAYQQGSEIRSGWVHESLLRIDEGHFHPKWDGFIQLIEN